MTRVISLEDRARKSGSPSDKDIGPQYLSDIDTLYQWCASNLVDILETHLQIDLSPLRKVAYSLATKNELREDGFDETEIDRMLAEGRQAQRAAWQSPDELIHAITALVTRTGEDQSTFPPALLEELTQHPNGTIWYGEEAYFSNGQFAEDLTRLKVLAERAKARGAKKVRIILDQW